MAQGRYGDTLQVVETRGSDAAANESGATSPEFGAVVHAVISISDPKPLSDQVLVAPSPEVLEAYRPVSIGFLKAVREILDEKDEKNLPGRLEEEFVRFAQEHLKADTKLFCKALSLRRIQASSQTNYFAQAMNLNSDATAESFRALYQSDFFAACSEANRRIEIFAQGMLKDALEHESRPVGARVPKVAGILAVAGFIAYLCVTAFR